MPGSAQNGRYFPSPSLLLVCFLWMPASADAQESSPYCLRDDAGQPLSGAHVSLLGRTETVSADPDGCFRLARVPPVPFELAVFDARGAWRGVIRVESAERRNLTLPASVSESVAVRGGVPTETDPAPAAGVTVLSRDELAQSRPVSVGAALEDVPGGGQLERGHTAVPALRGLARGRTLVLLDGARVTAERRAGPSGGYLDPLALDGIEIVRGPGSVAYGSDAMGGIIHAQTPIPLAGAFAGRAVLAAGVGETGFAGLVETHVPVARGTLLLQAHQRWFGDYDAAGREIENSAARSRGVLTRGLLPVGSGRILLGIQVDESRDVGKPDRETGVVRTTYPDEDSTRFTLKAELPPPPGFSLLEVQAFLGRYRLLTERDRRPSAGVTRQIATAEVDANDASLRLLVATHAGGATLRAGLDGHGRFGLEALGTTTSFLEDGTLASREREVSIEDAQRLGAGLFVEGERPFLGERLTVSLGLRGDWTSTRNSSGFFGDRSDTRTPFSGYLAGTARVLPEGTLTLQYARGFREPSLSDRYFRGISGRGFVVGNPDLEPERSDQWDVAYRQFVGGSARVAVYGYLYRIHDLVERYRSGADFAFRNRGTEELKGVELESDVDLPHGLTMRLALSAASGRIRDDDSRPADVPPRTASLTFHHAPHEGFWWRSRLVAVARDDDPGPTEVERSGYAVVDLSGGLPLPWDTEAVLTVRNVFDKDYVSDPDAAAVPSAGRSVWLTLTRAF